MQDKTQLFNELKKLSKRANQRILRLERLTGKNEIFATKQLADFLSSSQVQGWTKSGRVRVSSKMTETQMQATIKATKMFLEEKYSSVANVKQLKQDIEKSIGMKLSWEQLGAMYTAQELWRWVAENFDSKFWTQDAPLIFTMNKETWVEYLADRIDGLNDIDVINHLKAIYDYIKKHGLRGVVRID